MDRSSCTHFTKRNYRPLRSQQIVNVVEEGIIFLFGYADNLGIVGLDKQSIVPNFNNLIEASQRKTNYMMVGSGVSLDNIQEGDSGERR